MRRFHSRSYDPDSNKYRDIFKDGTMFTGFDSREGQLPSSRKQELGHPYSAEVGRTRDPRFAVKSSTHLTTNEILEFIGEVEGGYHDGIYPKDILNKIVSNFQDVVKARQGVGNTPGGIMNPTEIGRVRPEAPQTNSGHTPGGVLGERNSDGTNPYHTPQPVVAPSPAVSPDVNQATQQALNNQPVSVPTSPPPVQKAMNAVSSTEPIVAQPIIPPVVHAVNPVTPVGKKGNQGGSRKGKPWSQARRDAHNRRKSSAINPIRSTAQPPPNVPPLPNSFGRYGGGPRKPLPYVNPSIYIPETSWKLPTRPLPVKALDNLDRVNITPVGMVANLYGSSQTSSPGAFSNLLDTIGGNINRRVSAVGSIYRQDILDTLHGGDLKKALKLFHVTESSHLGNTGPFQNSIDYTNYPVGIAKNRVTHRMGQTVSESTSTSYSPRSVFNIFHKQSGANSLNPHLIDYDYINVLIPQNKNISINTTKFLPNPLKNSHPSFRELGNSENVSRIKIRKQDLLGRNTSSNPSFYRGDIHTPQTPWSRSSTPFGHSNIPKPTSRIITETTGFTINPNLISNISSEQLDYFHTLSPQDKKSWMGGMFSGVSEDQIGDMALDKYGVNLEGMTTGEKVWAIAGSKAKRVGLKASNYYKNKAIEAGADPAAWLGHAVKSSKPFRLAKAIGSLGLDVGSAGLAMTYNAYKIGTNNKPLFHQEGETLKFNESAKNLIIRGVAGATILKSIRNAANYRNPRVHTDDYTSSGYGNLGNPSDQMLDLYYQHR